MPVDTHLSVLEAAAAAHSGVPTIFRVATVRTLFAALVLAVFAPPLRAQQYKSDPVDDKANVNRALAQACAGGTKNYATEKERVAEFFTKYYFPSMTRYQPADLEKLGKARYGLFDLFLWKTSNADLQHDLTDWAYTSMEAVVKGQRGGPPYHPAVRYNAVLILGMLDQEYAIEQGANRRPPKPLAKANTLLVQIVNAAAAGNPVPPVLVAGALIGLERHAKYRDGLPRDAIEPMTAAVLKLVTQDKPKLDVDRDVYAWIRLKAASALAQLGSVGTNNQVHDALVKMIGDGRSLDDRCATAALLANIKYEGAKVDPKAVTEKMLALSGDVAEAEAKRAGEFREKRLSTSGGIPMRVERGPSRGRSDEGGYGGFSSEEQDEYPRRHILARLIDLRTGLKTATPIVPEDARKKFDAIVAALNPVIDAAANKDTVSLNVANAVVSMANTIKGITGATSPAVTAAEEAAFAAPAEPPPAGAPASVVPADATPKAPEKGPAAAVPAAAPPAN